MFRYKFTIILRFIKRQFCFSQSGFDFKSSPGFIDLYLSSTFSNSVSGLTNNFFLF